MPRVARRQMTRQDRFSRADHLAAMGLMTALITPPLLWAPPQWNLGLLQREANDR